MSANDGVSPKRNVSSSAATAAIYQQETVESGRLGRGDAIDAIELHRLIDSSLGPSGAIWRQQRKHESMLVHHLTAGTKPSSLAYNVGALAKLGQFDAALKLMEELAKQNNHAALEM